MYGVYIHIPLRTHTRGSTTPQVPVAGYRATDTDMGMNVDADSLATRTRTHVHAFGWLIVNIYN